MQTRRRPERLATVDRARGLLSAPAAPVDSVARLAAAAVTAPMSLVTLVGPEQVYVLGRHGAPDATDSAPDVLFAASCSQSVVSAGHAVRIDDARTDPQARQFPAAQQVACLGCPVHSAAGEPVGAVCVFDTVIRRWTDADVAAIGAAARVVEGMLRGGLDHEELSAELARSKDEFIALVGHEMRTPLTSVSAYTEMLLADEALEPKVQRNFLGIIHRNVVTLCAIIDDLLDLAGLESGYITIRAEQVDLAVVIREAVSAVRPSAEAKAVVVRTSGDASVATVLGDHGRLRQVIDNLLTNAVTYTLGGGSVDVRIAAEDAAYRVTVTDTGIGIPPAERQQLFQRFFRASNTRSQGIPGTGLGLTISRTIVERHAGTIAVRDDAEPGTTFEVRLPSAP